MARVRTNFPLLTESLLGGITDEDIVTWANDLIDSINLFQRITEDRAKANTNYDEASATGLTGAYTDITTADIKAGSGIVDIQFHTSVTGAVFDFKIVRTDSTGDTDLIEILANPVGLGSWMIRDIIPLDSAADYKIKMKGVGATADEITMKVEEVK